MAQSKNRAGIPAASLAAAFVGAALVGVAHAGTLAVGPVEQVNLKTSTIVVLGQVYQVDAATLIKTSAGKTITLGSLAPDTLVSVAGTETASGQTSVDSITSLPDLDVPGATPLFVTGIASAESPTGQIKVGHLSVDVVATLTGGAPKFQAGNLVEITGTQPNPNGLFLASTIAVSSGIQSNSSEGLKGGGAAASEGLKGGGAAASEGLKGGGAAASEGLKGGGN